MKTNRWIDLSQRFYRQLLRLYPQAYRTTYEMEMLHVFTDQCREAYQQQGRLGILSLWLRTFVDVGKTVVIEHIIDPNAKAGLLEATPNTPLPWKGVLLVLIPGLVFFVSQTVQLTSDKDWFFFAYYRAAYFLIVPVLLVWMLTRRFPVWGLIPLGLLYGTLGSYNPDYLTTKLGLYSFPDSSPIYPTPISPGYLITVSVCVVFLCGLIGYYARRRQISPGAWKWLGLYGLMIIFQIAMEFYSFGRRQSLSGQGWTPVDVKNYFFQMPLWFLYDSLPFLLLIFVGMFFARKYGGLSFLLPLGYLLPTIVFGRYGVWSDIIPFSVVVLTVLIYRFVVALVAPVWLARAASIPGRQRAAVIPIAVAIFCHMSLTVIIDLAIINQYGLQRDLFYFIGSVWNQLIIAAGLGLAVTLYLPNEKGTEGTSPPPVTATE